MQAALEPFLQDIARLCPAMTGEELQRFAQGLYTRKLVPKERWLTAGGTADAMAYVSSGLLKTVLTAETGEQANVNFVREGEFAGDYLAFNAQQPCRFDFHAIEPCDLVCFGQAHFVQSMRDIPALERYFRIQLERVLAHYVRRTLYFVTAGARERYQRFSAEYPDLFRRVSVSDLSSYLGIQRQSLTRIRKQLYEGR